MTGGAGFIGSHLCEELLRREDLGVELLVCVDYMSHFDGLYDRSMKERNLEGLKGDDRFKFKEWDIRDGEEMKGIFEWGLDLVVHLAALAGVRGSIDRGLEYTNQNVRGTHEVLELCREYGVRDLVFGSSSSVYGKNESVPFSEEDRVDFPSSPYGWTKRSGELLCYNYYDLFGLSVVILRFFTVYGPRQRPDLAIHRFTRLMEGGYEIEVYGDGTSGRDYTYVADTVGGIIGAIEYLRCGVRVYRVFNLGRSEVVRLKDLIGLLEGYLGRKAKVRVLGRQAGDMELTYADIGRARLELGYNPKVGIEEGLESFVKWYRGQ